MKLSSICSISLLLFGCQTTSFSELDVNAVNIDIHPVVSIEVTKLNKQLSPIKLSGVDYSKAPWIDFYFELKTEDDVFYKPTNISVLNSSHPDASNLIRESRKAFSKWVYHSKDATLSSSKKYYVRFAVNSESKYKGFNCSVISCIKK